MFTVFASALLLVRHKLVAHVQNFSKRVLEGELWRKITLVHIKKKKEDTTALYLFLFFYVSLSVPVSLTFFYDVYSFSLSLLLDYSPVLQGSYAAKL